MRDLLRTGMPLSPCFHCVVGVYVGLQGHSDEAIGRHVHNSVVTKIRLYFARYLPCKVVGVRYDTAAHW